MASRAPAKRRIDRYREQAAYRPEEDVYHDIEESDYHGIRASEPVHSGKKKPPVRRSLKPRQESGEYDDIVRGEDPYDDVRHGHGIYDDAKSDAMQLRKF